MPREPTQQGANEVIISMPVSEYISRWLAEDNALRDAAQLQSYEAKCDNCRVAKTTVLCSYAVDTSTPPMERRGCCNHCYKLHRVCGSAFFSYARAVPLPLLPTPQHASGKRDSSIYVESDDENERVSKSFKCQRGSPPKRVERDDEVVQKQPETVQVKRRFYRYKRVQGSTITQRTSAVSSDVRAPTGGGPNQSAIQPPVSQTRKASAHAEIFQILRDIGTSVRRIEDIMGTCPDI
ncbi:hypothetical protein F5887DRAFT_1004092 [Amanita rubescens]|nr:hypothetical protein F5887DRAFT_1004092 [Amanita rubescens]